MLELFDREIAVATMAYIFTLSLSGSMQVVHWMTFSDRIVRLMNVTVRSSGKYLSIHPSVETVVSIFLARSISFQCLIKERYLFSYGAAQSPWR